ncbi:hypothetical protein KIPB_006286, partial [Kipferlia bialata]|eukprot:g6286.t1
MSLPELAALCRLVEREGNPATPGAAPPSPPPPPPDPTFAEDCAEIAGLRQALLNRERVTSQLALTVSTLTAVIADAAPVVEAAVRIRQERDAVDASASDMAQEIAALRHIQRGCAAESALVSILATPSISRSMSIGGTGSGSPVRQGSILSAPSLKVVSSVVQVQQFLRERSTCPGFERHLLSVSARLRAAYTRMGQEITSLLLSPSGFPGHTDRESGAGEEGLPFTGLRKAAPLVRPAIALLETCAQTDSAARQVVLGVLHSCLGSRRHAVSSYLAREGGKTQQSGGGMASSVLAAEARGMARLFHLDALAPDCPWVPPMCMEG